MGVSYLAADESLDNLVAAAQAAATDDTPTMAAILARFEGLALSIARSLTSSWSLQQDAAQGARLGLVQAVRSHQAGTAGFPAYAKRYMKGAALRTLRATLGAETSVDPADYEWLEQPQRDTAPEMTADLIDLIAVLTPEQQIITKAHYIGDVSFRDIAHALGVSKPAISQRFTTIYRALRPVAEGALAA
jgi:RNA polymerase sigma factor (sigma-70 family)